MRTIIFASAILLATMNLQSQVLSQSADGKSTVIVDGASLGLDVTKTSLDFTYNNYFSNATKSNCLLLGTQVTGSNASGVTDLFKTGNIVPKSSFSGLLGGSFSRNTITLDTGKLYKLSREQNLLTLEYEKLKAVVIGGLKSEAVQIVCKTTFLSEDSAMLVQLQDSLVSAIRKSDREEYAKAYFELKPLYDKYMPSISKKDKEIKSILKGELPKTYRRLIVYTDFGLSSSSFKWFKSLDTTNFNNSFKKEKFRGGFVGVGANYQHGGHWIFGLKYSYVETNNFDELDATSYKLETKNTNSTQILTSEKTIEGYSGDYKRHAQHEFAGDVLWFKPVGDSTVFAFDLYGKYTQYSNDTISYCNIGLSWFAFKPNGKFIVGLYVEAPDILNQQEEDKDAEDQRDLLNRISFGVVARFSISTMGSNFYGK